jgi:hypothetical protein
MGLHLTGNLVGLLLLPAPERSPGQQALSNPNGTSSGYLQTITLTWDVSLSGKLGGSGPWSIELVYSSEAMYTDSGVPRPFYAGGGGLELSGPSFSGYASAGSFYVTGPNRSPHRGTIAAVIRPGPVRITGRWEC